MQSPVEKHYSGTHLFERILIALEKTGVDKTSVSGKDLSAADEFHVRGLAVTKELASRGDLQKGTKVLDVGCGLGGPARFLAGEYDCFVTGIDITQEYVRTATLLSELTGLQDRTNFIQADALHLPFDDNSFDLVWTQHVQMNVLDKKKFYAEISRVLKQNGQFIYYDIFSVANDPIYFPVPWAEIPAINHLVTIDTLHGLLTSSGLNISDTTDQTQPGIDFFSATIDKIKTNGAPPISLELIMGDSLLQKLTNLHRNLVEKKVRLESGICRKV